MAYTLDTTLGELMDNPQVKPLLDKQFPGLSSNMMVSTVKGLSLEQLVDNPIAGKFGITKEKAEQLLEEANKIV